jgi:glutamine amidotransferase
VTRVAVLDYGMGNLRSVEKALEHVGAEAEITRDHDRITNAAGVVLPGVGAFPKAIEAVRALELDHAIAGARAGGVPVLGVCLGLQLLFESSSELGGGEGLGLLQGSVEPLDAPGLKVPQIGWNEVAWSRESRLTRGLPDPCAFYHVHSFAVGADERDVLGTAEYGSPFVSAVERTQLGTGTQSDTGDSEPSGGEVFGVQFHPEKSGPSGLALLGNFVGICAEAEVAGGLAA